MLTEQGKLTSALKYFSDYPCAFLYLTNECNYRCSICYTNSLPGLIKTRVPSQLLTEIIYELRGTKRITVSGGEVSFLPYSKDFIKLAAQSAKLIRVFTNGSGFLKNVRKAENNNIFDTVIAIKEDLELATGDLPSNVELAFPVTDSHLDSSYPAHKFHRAIITAASQLAKEWENKTDKPKVRFIAKNSPGNFQSGYQLIKEFGIQKFGSAGAAYPGGIYADGRARNISLAKKPRLEEDKPTSEIHVNYLGIYESERPLLRDLSEIKPQNRGKIKLFSSSDTFQEIIDETAKYYQLLTLRN